MVGTVGLPSAERAGREAVATMHLALGTRWPDARVFRFVGRRLDVGGRSGADDQGVSRRLGPTGGRENGYNGFIGHGRPRKGCGTEPDDARRRDDHPRIPVES